ncbi:MAG: SDR family NAD(P)-dependent oxidoreductase [Anaerolineales bacterium]|jgi:NAD(P)-dependent dehydrogenase (short-subunit alcohol dehydrogenase family)
MREQIFMVTGATGAIGEAIAQEIAKKNNSQVILACRNERKANIAVDRIIRKTANEDVYYVIVDVSRKKSVWDLAARWDGNLDVLINNAATTPKSRVESPEGIELQFATNVLGYFWMTKAFTDILNNSAPARVINVASYWAGDLDLDDLEFKNRKYSNNRAYRQSKQANRMLTVAFSKKLKPLGISVNACHPGDVNSKLSNDLGFSGHESPEQGAKTPVWLAVNQVGNQNTGKYFEQMREVRDRFGEDQKAIDKLYSICSNY